MNDKHAPPLGTWRFALNYLRASEILDGGDPDHPGALSNVAYQCACQGIELAYKSYIRASGKNADDLMAVGHPLLTCKDVAVGLGFPAPSADHREALEMVDPYYRVHEFRYIVPGGKRYPPLGRLLGAGAQVLYDAAPMVAQAYGEPGHIKRMRLELSARLGQTPPK